MRQLKEDISFFLHQKMFVVILALTAVGSYGFAVTHESIGIDDTMVDVYLNDGIEVLMGRWTIYLINKLFYLGEFMPHITEIGGGNDSAVVSCAVLYIAQAHFGRKDWNRRLYRICMCLYFTTVFRRPVSVLLS